MITICSQVYSYQKRFWWMLSSLNNQTNKNFIVRASIHKNDPFYNFNDKIKETFKELNLVFEEYTNGDFGRRGYVRNNDFNKCTTEWLLYTDADILFPPNYIEELSLKLPNIIKESKQKIISVPRLSMEIEDGYKLVDSVDYTTVIKDPFELAKVIPLKWSFKGKVTGAGYFQLIHLPTVKAFGVTNYVTNIKQDLSILGKKGTYLSDISFRKKLQGVHSVKNLPPLIHINHYRKKFNPEKFINPFCN
jgi:hypothetical protein